MPVALLLAFFAISNFADYPRLRSDVQAHYVSSYDRTGGNDDGFDGTYSAIYVDESGEHVIFDVKGPGTLYNLWFTSRVNGRSPLGWGRIKFYFDDEASPRIDMDVDDLFSGRNAPFVPPFVYHAFQSTGGYVSYLPFGFQKRLKITTENRVGFYNAYYHSYAPDRIVETWTGQEDTSALERLWTRAGDAAVIEGELHSGKLALDRAAMPDGEPVPSKRILFEHEGPAVINSLRFTPLFPLTDYELNHILLRLYWDDNEDEAEASVSAPLGSFFGSGLGEASVRSALIGMSPSGSYYCNLPMPFWKSARIELVNENPEPTPEIFWEVRTTANRFSIRDAGYFNARYRKEWPTTLGQDYRILDAEGRGIYVGQVMTVEPLRAEIKRWWEGDLRIYLDGRRHPAFHGTGHEDEYLGGWSNEWLMNPYSLPMHGEPKTTALKQVDFQWSAATTVYRFFVEGIPFQNGISVSTEHGSRNTANAMYSSVAFFYQSPNAMTKLSATDVDGSLSLTSSFEGRSDATFTDEGLKSDVGEVFRLVLDVPEGYQALRLRRLYAQHQIQEAEVYVNGARTGVWYSAATNAERAWAESDYILPESVTRGQSKLDIEIRPLRVGWTAFRYELWGLP
jgi:hypothetical protein